jgi:uncharacterized OB-fold protein
MSNSQMPFTAHSFHQYLSQGKLKASRCPDCQQVFLPVRALCPDCGQIELEWVDLSGKGKLAAFTSVYIGPTFMNEEGFSREKPYLTGIVELDEGPRISARLLGLDPENPAAIKIGIPLVFTEHKIGEGEGETHQLAFRSEG